MDNSSDEDQPGPSNRNLFASFRQDVFEYVDDQSDLEVESDNEELDRHYQSDSDSSDNDEARPSPTVGPTGATTGDAGDQGMTQDGWNRNCASAGANIQDFLGPCGVTSAFDLDAEPIDYFFKLLPQEFFEVMAEQTNLYAHQKERKKNPDWTLQNSKWTLTDADEMKAFIAIYIYMGIVKLPNYRLYWSSDPTFNQQFVYNLMPRNRYEALSSNLHLIDQLDNPQYGEEGHDVLHKVRPVLDIVQKSWAENYDPGRSLCVDEAMVKFKGRCAFRQYLPAKQVKWGLKVWAICDSETNYMLNMSVYTGKKNDLVTDDVSLGERVVRTLAQPYLHKHHVIYMDNYFTCLPLFQYLLQHGTYACGTIRTNRKGLPVVLKNSKVVRKAGESRKLVKDDVLAIAWFDKRKVMLISTAHSSDDALVTRRASGQNVKEYPRPIAIQEYSENYSGVDKNDRLRTYYGLSAKSVKWWKYILWFCLDVSLINGYILYQRTPGGPRRKPLKHMEFNSAVMKSLSGRYTSRKRMGRPAKRIATHELTKIETKRGQRNCVYCKKQGRTTPGNRAVQTTFMCIACNAGLCAGCFEPFHQ